MKYALKKLTSIGAAVALSFSVVSCDSSGKKDDSKSGRSNSPEAAIQNFLQGILDADADDVCKAMAPEELWDYVCKNTGLSREKILQRLLGRDTLEDFLKYFNEIGVKASDIEIEDKHDENDNGYYAFGQAMSNAGIDENIDHLYYVETGPDRESYYDMDGWAYEIDDNWYFGSEWVLEDLIEVAIEGYSALPEEYDYEYQEDTYDTSPKNQDYENNANQEYNENTEHNSKSESESVNLCADWSNWRIWSNEECGCDAVRQMPSDGATLLVLKTGGVMEENGELVYYYYFNQLKYDNLVLERSAAYRLEFDYEASENILFEMCVQQNYEPYHPYVEDIIDVPSTGSGHYSTEFVMMTTDDNANIVFNCNYPDVATPYTLTIKNLTLVRIN